MNPGGFCDLQTHFVIFKLFKIFLTVVIQVGQDQIVLSVRPVPTVYLDAALVNPMSASAMMVTMGHRARNPSAVLDVTLKMCVKFQVLILYEFLSIKDSDLKSVLSLYTHSNQFKPNQNFELN